MILCTEGTVEDYEEFLDKYELLLHPSHYHMLTAKHSLMQMLGRTEGYLIQDMSEEMVRALHRNRILKILSIC